MLHFWRGRKYYQISEEVERGDIISIPGEGLFEVVSIRDSEISLIPVEVSLQGFEICESEQIKVPNYLRL